MNIEKLPNWFRQTIFSMIVGVPPIIIAFFTQNVQLLVSITGGYGGMGIMFIFPAICVFCARRLVNYFFYYHI